MIKRKKILLFSIMIGTLILAVSAVFIGIHKTGTVNHGGEVTLKTHGMTTAKSSYTNQNMKPLVNNTIIRITSTLYDQEIIAKLMKIKEIKDVYVYVMVQTEKGEFIGVNPTKDILIPADSTLIVPQLIEGRLLSAEDANENAMIVGSAFAKNNTTEDGYTILGTLGYHPKPLQLEGNDMQVVGVVGGTSSIENTVILPFDILEKIYKDEDKKYELYVTLVKDEDIDKTLQELAKLNGDFVDIEIYQK